MRFVMVLVAAAALFAACHSRTEAEVGAAPDRGDTTAVAVDTSAAIPTDSAMGQAPSDTTAAADTTSAAEMPGASSNDTSIIAH
jgi:type IV pilus biogenesis protein CpaD/CtpE